MFLESMPLWGAQAATVNQKQPYVKVKWVDPEEFRHLCDRCATSISDLHQTCRSCAAADGYDLCLHCCADLRVPDQVRAKYDCSPCVGEAQLLAFQPCDVLVTLHSHSAALLHGHGIHSWCQQLLSRRLVIRQVHQQIMICCTGSATIS